MNVLDKIIAYKTKEVIEKKTLITSKYLERSINFSTMPVSLVKYLHKEEKSGIIAEYKTKSPSKGLINEYAEIEKTTIGYMQAGASALSILTDNAFFGGDIEHLREARSLNYCPILQKDFIIDEFQIIEAKSAGADAILLIANVLSKQKLKNLAMLAKSLRMEVLMEVHSIEEIDHLNENIDILGINNRNLQTFKTSINHSMEIIDYAPKEITKVSESAIKNTDDIIKLKKAGFKGFLIGEQFMRQQNPSLACKEFIRELKTKESSIKEQVKYHK